MHTKPGLGDIQQAEFRGNFRFVDGTESTAEAPIGVYQVSEDRLDLSPSSTEPGPPPTVTNPQLTVHARTIALTMSTQVLKADTDVRSVMEQKDDAGRGAGGPPGRGTPKDAAGRGTAKEDAGRAGQKTAAAGDTKMPSLLQSDQPVTVRSNRLAYDGNASHALYTGSARLTQPGGTELVADTIELDDKTGNLSAHDKVRTKMPIDDVDPKTKKKTTTDTIGTSDVFVYEDAKRLATYTSTGAELAHFVGPTGDITASGSSSISSRRSTSWSGRRQIARSRRSRATVRPTAAT